MKVDQQKIAEFGERQRLGGLCQQRLTGLAGELEDFLSFDYRQIKQQKHFREILNRCELFLTRLWRERKALIRKQGEEQVRTWEAELMRRWRYCLVRLIGRDPSDEGLRRLRVKTQSGFQYS